MKATAFVLFLTLFMSCRVTAQHIYACTGGEKIVRMEPGQCVVETLSTRYLIDIAYEGNRMYATSYIDGLVQLDPFTGEIAALYPQPPLEPYNSLTGDGEGNLYLGGAQLVRYNLSTGVYEELGNFFDYSFQSAGDLLFRGERLYLAAVSLTQTDHYYLMEIHLDPFSMELIMPLPSETYGLTGTTLPDSLMYVAAGDDLYLLNVEAGTTDLVCDQVYPYGFYGMTYARDTIEGIPPGLPDEPFVTQNLETGTVSVKLPGSKGHDYYRVFDVIGQIVREDEFLEAFSTLDISEFAPGVYYLEIGEGKIRSYHQLVVPW